jgi:hypothetical protein
MNAFKLWFHKAFVFALGVNYRQAIPAILLTVGMVGKLYHDVKTKSFETFFTDWDGFGADVGVLATAFGIANAKSKQLTGGSGNGIKDTVVPPAP